MRKLFLREPQSPSGATRERQGRPTWGILNPVEGRELDSQRAERASADLTLELPWLGLILLSALALRISVLIAIEPTPLAGDEADYYRRAVRLVTDGRMEGLGGRAPGNEFFFAALFQVFGISTFVARVGNVVLSAVPFTRWADSWGGVGRAWSRRRLPPCTRTSSPTATFCGRSPCTSCWRHRGWRCSDRSGGGRRSGGRRWPACCSVRPPWRAR